MKINATKMMIAAVLALSSFFSESAFAATSEMYEQFDEWVTKYILMGILPTTDELRVKRKSLKMDSDDAQSALNIAIQSNKDNDVFEKSMNVWNRAVNITIMANDSTSKGTHILAEKLVKALNDSVAETKNRDVDGYAKTFDDIQGLAKRIADRIDSEDTIKKIPKGIPSGKNQSQLADEQEIRSLLITFKLNEENPDFMPVPWVRNLLDTKVNPYITRMNEANN